jgi:hypothetical protein
MPQDSVVTFWQQMPLADAGHALVVLYLGGWGWLLLLTWGAETAAPFTKALHQQLQLTFTDIIPLVTYHSSCRSWCLLLWGSAA